MNLFYFLFQSMAELLTSIKVRTDETAKKFDTGKKQQTHVFET